MAAVWKISLDLSGLAPALAQVQGEVLSRLHATVGVVAMETHARWQDAVQKARLWKGLKDPYFDSITWRFTGDLSAEVVTDFDPAKQIETGRPPRDLKRMLDTSPRVRTSKTGKRFLYIPFRHNIEALEKAGVYAQAKALPPSSITGTGTRPSGLNALNVKTHKPFLVPQQHYAWGGRMPSEQSRYSGLYKFNTSSGKQKSSAYLTFRTMVEGSPGWIVPAQPGLYIAKRVADDMQQRAPVIFEQALKGAT